MKRTLKPFKNLAFYFVLLLTSYTKISAQDCKNYYYMSNNAQVEITIYNGKGDVSGLQTWKISNVDKDANGFKSKADMTFTDDKGREIAKGSGVYRCNDGKLQADMRIMLPLDQMQQIKSSDAKVDDGYVEYPAVLQEGMQLPDAFVDMDMNTSGLPTSARYEMKNRKVIGKENITSDAGSWQAYKISFDALIKIKMAGISIPKVMKTTEWFVPDFGIVKAESFNNKGKKLGSSLLTKIKKQ